MNDERKKGLFEESMQFIGMLYEEKVVRPDMDEGLWFSNFGPPLSVIYYHYIRHYFNELDIDDIDDMCEVFANTVIPARYFLRKKVILAKMKETNHNMDNMLSMIRSDDIPYDMALSSILFVMFQLQPDNDVALTIIANTAQTVSDHRTFIEDSVLKSKEVIIEFVNDLYRKIDEIYEFKKRAYSYPEEYTKAMLLFCMKYFGSHYCAPDLFTKYKPREYITQHFIKLVAREVFEDHGSATMCYTMWNHLRKHFAPEEIEKNKEKSLLGIIVTTLIAIDKQAENETNRTMQVYHVLAEALNSYEFHF